MLKVLMFAISFFLIISCSKNEPENSQPLATEPIISLAVGNYWIYQTYSEDADGIFQPKSSLDSIYIESTQNIGGQEYFIFNEYSFGLAPYILRDSSGYLLNLEGQILYSPKDNDGILYGVTYNLMADNSIVSSFKVEGAGEIETPAGVFDTRRIVGTFDFSQSSTDCDKEFVTNYAQNVGVVREEAFFATNCRTIYKELVRYNIQ